MVATSASFSSAEADFLDRVVQTKFGHLRLSERAAARRAQAAQEIDGHAEEATCCWPLRPEASSGSRSCRHERLVHQALPRDQASRKVSAIEICILLSTCKLCNTKIKSWLRKTQPLEFTPKPLSKLLKC